MSTMVVITTTMSMLVIVILMMTVMIMLAMATGLVVMMLTFKKAATRLVVTAKVAGRSQGNILVALGARSERRRPPMTAEQQPRRCQGKAAATNRRDTRSTAKQCDEANAS